MAPSSENTTLPPVGAGKDKARAEQSNAAKPRSSRKPPTVTPISSDLLAATLSAEPERLRDHLKAICDRVPGVTELLLELLHAEPSLTCAADDKAAAKKSKKRPRMATCVKRKNSRPSIMQTIRLVCIIQVTTIHFHTR